MTLVKQSQELKTVSYHKLYDILKQHQNEVNDIRAERLARTANPLALVAQQQLVYHPQNQPTQNTQYSSTRLQQSTKNRGKAIVTSFAPTYDPEPATVTKDDEMSKEKDIDKLMALISLSINKGTGYDNQRAVNVAGAREYGHLNAEQTDLKDDTDDEFEYQELEAYYMYMAQIQEVTPDPVDNYRPIFDDEPMHKDPTWEAARQLLEQAPRSPECVPEDHVPVYIPKPEHPKDLVPAEDEAPTPPLPPFFLSPRIRPPHTRAAMKQMRATAPSTYHPLVVELIFPLPAPSTSRRADIPEADTPPRKQPGPTIETRLRDTERRIMTALELVNRRVTYQVDVCTRESLEFCTQDHNAQKDRAAVRAEIKVLRRERLAYEQEGMETLQALARSEAHCRALEARVTVLETEVRRHEWQRQAADDLAVQHIMRTQALEAGARVDTLEDTGSSS
ncbi:hypothetical protein Tco_1475218 [Tanacetum coccineum]